MIADKYRIEEVLGRGGMGAVFGARHLVMDRAVALKWLLPHVAQDAESLQRFVREAKAAGRIEHPNVVDVYDVGEHEGALFLVMERLRGRTLAELLKARKPPYGETIRMPEPAP